MNEKLINLCEALENNYYAFCAREIKFVCTEGKRYIKIVAEQQCHKSVHAFIDKSNGDIYKPASWNAPAKGVRYNLINDYEKVLKVCDWAGSWLYR